jgi:hypothetical protein
MKYIFIFIIAVTFSSCACQKEIQKPLSLTEFKNDINSSIIDGFYNNDTVGISQTIYLLK